METNPVEAPAMASTSTPPARPQRVARSALPYYLAAVFAAGTMAWYLLVFVPSKLEYFVGLKLRALAVAGSQVKTRAENLASAFTTAPHNSTNDDPSTGDTATYLRVLVPDIQLSQPSEPSAPGLRLVRALDPRSATSQPAASPPPVRSDADRQRECDRRQTLCGDVPWDDVAAQAAAVSREEFDDLVVAMPTGDVVWQREKTTPRIGNLAQVMDEAPDEGGWFSFSWSPRAVTPKVDAKGLPTAVAVKTVDLGGKPILLLVQAVVLSADAIQSFPAPPSTNAKGEQIQATDPHLQHNLYVAGIVPMSSLRGQAMSIPVVWVVVLSLPVILVFLGLPFIKLATLTSRERFSFADVVLLLAATLLLAGLAATIPLTETAVDDAGDGMLSSFAGNIQDEFVKDVSRVQALATELKGPHADAVDGVLQPCLLTIAGQKTNKRCNFWAATVLYAQKASTSTPTKPAVLQMTSTSSPPTTAGAPLEKESNADPVARAIAADSLDLDVIVWIDEFGQQIDKWTTKAQVTGLTTHRPFQHYRDLTVNRLWTLDGKDRFTIEPLRSPTTAELGVLVAFPIADAARIYAEPEKGLPDRRQAKYLAFNIRPHSLLDAVVPPGFGFAVITPEGKVLFHSQESLSLEENFFEEVGDPQSVRARAESGRVVTWTGDYHGRPHRIHMQRLAMIEDCPWRIVTFRDLTPAYAALVAHHGATVRLAALNLLAFGAAALLVWLYAAAKRRDIRDLLNVSTIARPVRLSGFVLLIIVALAVVRSTYTQSAGLQLDWIYTFFVLLPFVALSMSWLARRRGGSHRRASRSRWVAWSEMAALVLLVAALPAMGFARLAERVQTSRANERLLEETQRRIAARYQRVVARVHGLSYRFAATTNPTPVVDVAEIVEKSVLARKTDPKQYSYFDFFSISIVNTANGGLPASPEVGQTLVRFLLDWNPFPSRDLAGKPGVRVEGEQFQLDSSMVGFPALSIRDGSLALPSFMAAATSFSVPPLKAAFGFLLLCTTIVALCWARERLLANAFKDAPTLDTVLDCLPRNGKHGVMLIGAPRTRKDSVLAAALKARGAEVALRISLLDTDADPELAEKQFTAIAAPRPPWWQWRSGRDVSPTNRVWIDVSNFETQLVDHHRRKLALQLLERLLERGPSEVSRVVVLTTNVDPVAHFAELFDEERNGIYLDPTPEVALSRFATLLTRFHRSYVPLRCDEPGTDPWWHYQPRKWLDVLTWETNSPVLKDVREELKDHWRSDAPPSLEELARAISNRAVALYQLLWTSCTRREKLVLVQLSQEGFVTPQSVEVVEALIAKGLIVLRPAPAIFNYTFRAFLRRIERTERVREWEQVEGQGLWVVAGRLIASSVAVGGLFFLLTQGYSVEGLLPVLSGTGVFGIPLARNVIARFTSKEKAAPATA